MSEANPAGRTSRCHQPGCSKQPGWWTRPHYFARRMVNGPFLSPRRCGLRGHDTGITVEFQRENSLPDEDLDVRSHYVEVETIDAAG